jgi:hypothetical protein
MCNNIGDNNYVSWALVGKKVGEKGFVLEAVFVGCLGLYNQVVFVVLLVFVRVMVAL